MKIDKVKLLGILVVVLLLLNIATIAGVWVRLDPGKFRHEPPQGPKEFIISRLGFDDEQATAFEVLRREHFDTMETLRNQIRQEKEEMYDQLKSNATDTASAYHHLSNVIALEERAEKITFEHFRKVRALCDEEQKKHFDAIISQVIKMIGMPHRPGPGGPNGGLPPLP